MKVFITGATGYIGFTVASRFAAKGHHVMGLVRTTEGAKKVASAEIEPVMGDMEHPETYRVAAQSCELLIHCASDLTQDFHGLDKQTVQHLIQYARTTKLSRRFIYTSGVWLYGDTGNGVVTECSPLNPPSWL